jgi:hypothetical protein
MPDSQEASVKPVKFATYFLASAKLRTVKV